MRRFFSLYSNLEDLRILVQRLKSTNCTSEKIKLLKDYPHLHEPLRMIYDSNLHFRFTSHSLKNDNQINPYVANSLSSWINELKERPTKEAKEIVKSALKDYSEFKELLECIIDRNLKCRIGPKLIQKSASDSKVAEKPFECSLAYDWNDPLSQKFLKANGPWVYSRKLDGVRCITKLSPTSMSMNSRSGKPLPAPLTHFEDKLKILRDLIVGPRGNYILDGELCVMDELDREDFTRTSGLVRSSHIPTGTILWYFIFDCLTENELQNPSQAAKYTTRLARVPDSVKNIAPLAHFPINQSLVPFVEGLLAERCLQYGHEGLMLRLDTTGYFPGRTRTLLKVKQWEDAEFPVIGLERGPIRYLEDGIEKEELLVSSLIVKLEDGNTCAVGSGLSIKERKSFDESIIGRLVTVKYQGRLDGQLRFAIFKSIRNID